MGWAFLILCISGVALAILQSQTAIEIVGIIAAVVVPLVGLLVLFSDLAIEFLQFLGGNFLGRVVGVQLQRAM